MKHLALIAALFLAACVDTAPDVQTGRVPQPEITDTADAFVEEASLVFLATHPDDSQVVFCCVDEMCAEDEFCDFDGGFVCAPR